MEERKRIDVLLNGLIKENPVLVLVIGTCPTLATSTSVETGFGMGLAATAVLVCSNIVISALHNIIPDKVRIPCFITVIAGFVTIVQMLLQAFVPSLYSALGLYLPLIVVNCIILGRAEMFASKNGVLDSALDGIGMGLGFTLTLVIMGTIREVLGSGTWLAGDWFGLAKGFKGIPLLSNFIPGMSIMTMVPGGFFVYAIVMAAVHYFTKDKSKIRNEFGCDGCANAGNCADGECAQKYIIISMVLVNNYPLAQFLGICPFLGVSKDLDSSTGMGIAVTFVMVLATAVTWPIQQLLNKFGIGYLQTVVFILVIAALVQLVEMFMKKSMPALYKSLGIFLPLITTNCAVLGVCITNIDSSYNYLESLVNAFGAGIGFLFAMVVMAGVRTKLVDQSRIPESFRGVPIVLITAAILSLSFMGFNGMFS